VCSLARAPPEFSCSFFCSFMCVPMPFFFFLFLVPFSYFKCYPSLRKSFIDAGDVESTVIAANGPGPCPCSISSLSISADGPSCHLQGLRPHSILVCSRFQVVLDSLLAPRALLVSILISHLSSRSIIYPIPVSIQYECTSQLTV
jgi:hypothetical protein